MRASAMLTTIDAMLRPAQPRAAVASTAQMVVEVLYFDGCPGFAELLPRLSALVSNAEIVARQVTTSEDAMAQRFLGSPTVRVDGVDVEPDAAQREDFGLKCRLYVTPNGLRHAPSDEILSAALHRRTDRGGMGVLKGIRRRARVVRRTSVDRLDR
jgi:hypothetical protein